MAQPQNSTAGSGDEDDDYMKMTFEDPIPAKETSLQRMQRLKKEGLARGMVKSKAQLAEDEAASREKALSKSMLDSPSAKKSKGFAMMAKMGFMGGSLGKMMEGGDAPKMTEPIKVSLKEDRGGIGMESEKKRKLQEAMEGRDIKIVKVDSDEYRDRLRKEREDERLEKQFHAAQRVAEGLDEELEGGQDEGVVPTQWADSCSKAVLLSSRPLKSIPVLYRGLVRHREEKERDRRMRYDLDQSLSRLPTYDDEDEDEDDKKAMGKKKTAYVTAQELDEEDEELDAFNALEPGRRLEILVGYLRERYRYCFWCKMQYEGEEMKGCPGVTEEDHD